MGIVPPDIQGVTDWEPLARGGFATVWRARQPSLNRPVAVKVDDRTLEQESERRRFLGEAGAAGNLSGHPSIVTVYDTGILANGRPYLVMKYCSGGSLTSWLKPDNRQSTERICFVGVRIAEALVVAHEQGMLHRDVKPANILIDSYGNPGLADFGLTALEPGSTIGLTVAYAPPEVILGGQPSELGDVYQLAATLYALLSGNPPSNSSGGNMSLEDRVARCGNLSSRCLASIKTSWSCCSRGSPLSLRIDPLRPNFGIGSPLLASAQRRRNARGRAR